MNHAELRKICREVVETRHGEGAGADSHLAGIALALAAVVPALLDELEGLRAATAAFGNAHTVGDIPIVDDDREYTVRRAILIQFDTEVELRNAIAGRRLVFGLFGETSEDVQGR